MHGDPTVTFAGAGLDRAAHLRADPERLRTLAQDDRAMCLALWRGKPLSGPAGLGLLRPDHPVLATTGAQIFLGLVDGAPRFATDLSEWMPVGEDPDAGFLDQTTQHHPLIGTDVGFQELRAIMALLTPLEAEIAATAKAILGWHDTHRFCARCGQPSLIHMAGWQRSCPACKAQHFPRTDPVVIMLITHGNRVLLGRSPGWPDGMYSLLAGFMEPGETIEAAVRREVLEEAGVTVGRVRYLASQPWPFPASLMIGCWGEAMTDELTHDPGEIEEALWLTREDLAQVFAGLHERIRRPRQGAIAGYLMRDWLADRVQRV